MATDDIQLQHPVCEQPSCALKQGHMNQLRLADLLIRALSKDGTVDCIPNRTRIIPRSVCIECAHRVIRGRRALLTRAERTKFFLDDSQSSSTHAK